MKRKLNRIRKRRPQQAANQERKLHEFRKASALMSMRDNYDSFTPRWKGVIWTAEAELTAGLDELPWCNIKFACSMNGTSTTPWNPIPYIHNIHIHIHYIHSTNGKT